MAKFNPKDIEIKPEFAHLPEWMGRAHSVLKPDQEMILDYAMNRPFAGIFLKMGGGKTLITLLTLGHRRPAGHILVVAPPNIARISWPNEIRDWGVPVNHRSLDTLPRRKSDKSGRMLKERTMTPAERRESYARVLTDPPSLYTVGFDMLEDMVDYFATDGGRLATPDYSLWPFPNLIVDESQSVKDPGTKRFKLLKAIRPHLTSVLLLSGTPAAEETGNIWAQAYLLDQGQALYPSMAQFRARWFTEAYRVNNQVVKWNITEANRREIFARIAHLAISAENATLDIPPCNIIDHHVTFSKEETAAYAEFARDSVLTIVGQALAAHEAEEEARRIQAAAAGEIYEPVELDEAAADRLYTEVVAQNEVVLRGKLMQFAAGAIYRADVENADHPDWAEATAITRKPTVEIHNHKIGKVLDIIAAGDGSPVLIAYRFTSDRDRLLHWLGQFGHRAMAFDRSSQMLADWNAGKIPVMLIHPASAGHGLNFQHGGHTLIWFSLPESSEHYQQTNARLHRTGQTEEVTIHRIIVSGTVDEMLPQALADKRRNENKLLAALRKDLPGAAEVIPAVAGIGE